MNRTPTGVVTLAAAAGVAISVAAPAVGTASAPDGPVDLSAACPETVVIQKDWFPESEHGSLYELLGPDYTVDTDNKIVVGPLYSQGAPTGVNVEIRSGGPAIAASVEATFYADDSIMLAYGSTDGQILGWENTPMLSVMAPLEKNPQIVMWDPETYPNVETIADLGTEGVVVNAFPGQTFTEVFVAQGILSADQIDPSYDGGPSRFIGEGGAIAQQGFASAEPYQYEHAFDDWGRPVAYQLVHDAGLEVYSQTLAIRPDDLESLAPCLELLIPVIQQATVDFVTDPARTNEVIVDVVAQFATFWEYSPEVAAYSVETQIELGLTGNGPDDTLGNMEIERVQGVLDQMTDAEMAVPEGLTAEQLVTNQFIDESIAL